MHNDLVLLLLDGDHLYFFPDVHLTLAQHREQGACSGWHVDKAGLDIQASQVSIELRVTLAQRLARECFGWQVQVCQNAVALLGIACCQVGRDALPGDIQAATVDEERFLRALLDVLPEPARFIRQSRVMRVR